MKSGLDAAAFLASFSFSRSAAQPRAITLTCTAGTLTCHCGWTLWATLCLDQQGRMACISDEQCPEPVRSWNIIWSGLPEGSSWHPGQP